MSIKLYDDAVTNKIGQWIKDPNLRLLKPDESTRFFKMQLDLKDDKPLSLPLIAISRDKDIDLLETTKQPKTYDGFSLEKLFLNDLSKYPEKEREKILKQIENQSTLVNVVPIKLKYQIDIYCRFLEEADEYLRNFVFNLINYPSVNVEVPYNNINLLHKSKINLDSTVADNSDIQEHLFPDQFTRFTIRFSIDDAYLFSAPIIKNSKVESFEIDVVDRTDGDVVDILDIK